MKIMEMNNDCCIIVTEFLARNSKLSFIGLMAFYCFIRVAFREGEGGICPPENRMAPWAMLCVLLLILFLKDS